MKKTKNKDWQFLAEEAWITRERASVPVSGTKVGCAIRTDSGAILTGCNVEHHYLSTSIHAEANAIGTMIARYGAEAKAVRIVVTAKRHKFTPCGGCMDMIMQYGGELCEVGYQNDVESEIMWCTAEELMPEYPC